ncbi:flagellar outer arm dynein 14 kDa light chain LC5 [Tribonema minus]|uniref:Flagellar outer arm dynein 14 kDa light chain LC5 n=1 Tax=Tribonema minus TaxID=303371 RepID=A0A835ZHZ2_9STRA|nr:flagellar outer arm dynein 14 kDa light chain LC5 [Tribonema minus]
MRLLVSALVALCLGSACAFTGSFAGTSLCRSSSSVRSSSALRMAVIEVDSEEALDKTIAAAGSGLVVVDYSTTWCGPCKVIFPKYEELSNKYTNAVFLKVIGDSSQAATKLMKREGVRSVPSFHFWKDGKKVDQVNGANSEALETTIRDYA